MWHMTQRTHVYLPADVVDSVDRIAVAQDRTRSAEITRALRDHIQRHQQMNGEARMRELEQIATSYNTTEKRRGRK